MVYIFCWFCPVTLLYTVLTCTGFHEAIGDCIAYSVNTPKHLRKIGLLKTTEDDKEATINYLYKEALDKIAFLPMALVIDSWRWDIFEGKVQPEEYNCHWWKLRRTIQGFKPPNVRTSEDLDAGAKYHIPYGKYSILMITATRIQELQFGNCCSIFCRRSIYSLLREWYCPVVLPQGSVHGSWGVRPG